MKKISRIINVCLNDECADQDDYLERYGILKDVINGICDEWEPFNLDAIVFPGGFWHRTKYIGNRDYKYRKESLEKETFTKKAIAAVKKLQSEGFGKPLLVAGIDSCSRSKPDGFDIYKTKFGKNARSFSKRPKNTKIYGDQLCVAWSSKGIVGIGRKVFPVQPKLGKNFKDFDENYQDVDAPYYVTYARDFYDPKRVVRLESGRNALLCACYDIFGCSERYNPREDRTSQIEWLDDGTGKVIHVRSERDIIRKYVSKFNELIEKVDTALVSIHGFNSATGANYTERHGIAATSAALGGGMVIGSAHFKECLPSDENKATLASYNISKRYLNMKNKNKRKLKKLIPKRSLWIESSEDILIRLFECP